MRQTKEGSNTRVKASVCSWTQFTCLKRAAERKGDLLHQWICLNTICIIWACWSSLEIAFHLHWDYLTGNDFIHRNLSGGNFFTLEKDHLSVRHRRRFFLIHSINDNRDPSNPFNSRSEMLSSKPIWLHQRRKTDSPMNWLGERSTKRCPFNCVWDIIQSCRKATWFPTTDQNW